MSTDEDAAGLEAAFQEAIERCLTDEVDERAFIEAEEGDEVDIMWREVQAAFQHLTRHHVCRLCFRWFGQTFSTGHGHYSDKKNDFSKKQRLRNKKPSYLLCASCADVPLYCHACFKMVHLDEEPCVVASVEAVKAELHRRSIDDAQDPHASVSEASTPNSRGVVDKSDSTNASFASTAVAPAGALKRSGLIAMTVAGVTDRRAATPAAPNERRHVCLELFTLDAQVAAKTRAAVRNLSTVSILAHFHAELGRDSPTQSPTRSMPLHAVPIVLAFDALLECEVERRAEIESLWDASRFVTQALLEAAPAAEALLPDVPTLRVTEEQNESEGGLEANPLTAPRVPLLVLSHADDELSATSADDAALPSPSDASVSDAFSAALGEAPAPAFVSVEYRVDALMLFHLSELLDVTHAGIQADEARERDVLASLSSRALDSQFARSCAVGAVAHIVKQCCASAWVRHYEQIGLQELETTWSAPLRKHHQEDVVLSVTWALEGTTLLQSGALSDDAVDDDGVPMTARWMKFYFTESVARQTLWQDQVAAWQPKYQETLQRAENIERQSLAKSLLQQYTFQANQQLRQYFNTHVSCVALKMCDYVSIMMDKAEGRVVQLSFQCRHAVTRQDLLDDERVVRLHIRSAYGASRVHARERAARRLLTTDAWQLLIRELPTEERLKRFSMERTFVLEYRLLLRDFWNQTRMDLATLIRNCSHTFDSSLGDWVRRIQSRETTYFAFYRDSCSVQGTCGIPTVDCFQWPRDDSRQFSLFWDPQYGPPRKKLVSVQQGAAARGLRSKKAQRAKLQQTVGLAVQAVSFTESTDVTPRQGPLGHSKLIDDGPQQLTSALTALTSLMDVPCFNGSVRFTYTSLVEDVACWTSACHVGQMMLSCYPESSAFSDLFAEFEESVVVEFERKWTDTVLQREYSRLALLEQQVGVSRGPPKTKVAVAATGRRRKRRMQFSDSASSVMSAEDTATTATAADSGVDSGGERSNKFKHHEGDDLLSIPRQVLSLAQLPNYSMRNSFFGSQFMFGSTLHMFEQQWLPPVYSDAKVDAPEDPSALWGTTLLQHSTSSRALGERELDDDGEEIGSDFGDSAIAASRRARGAYTEATKASLARRSVKLDEQKASDVAQRKAKDEKSTQQMELYWSYVKKQQKAQRVAEEAEAQKNRTASVGDLRLSATMVLSSTGVRRRRNGSDAEAPSPSMHGSRTGVVSPSAKLKRGASPRSVGRVVLMDAFDMLDD